jgi:putative hydrolase of the HAD superfamily
MPLNPNPIRAIVFDYGNTLIRYGHAQLRAHGDSIAEALARLIGPPDLDRLNAIRARWRLAPYEGDPPAYRENNLARTITEMVRELYGVEPSAEIVNELLETRYHSFIRLVEAEPHVEEVLARLAKRYTLGLCSNYPDGPAIRGSLDKTGLTPYFRSIVVSGDLGYIKPHPILFATCLRELDVTAPQVLFVGDNWLADVQGAKRVGMQIAHMRRWEPPEQFEAQPGDYAPDATITHLTQLETLLETERSHEIA